VIVGEVHGFPLFAERTPAAVADAELERLHLGDGLPTVVPTEAGLQQILREVDDPDLSVGMMPPMYGELRVGAVAYQALIAGCDNSALPLLIAAAQACLDDTFNLLGVATTTGTAAVGLVANPRLGEQLGLRAGTNCLGPGARTNATIGRALSLVLRNLGGAREGIGDMATMGQPGKYTLCFAERVSALPSLASQLGVAALAAATVIGVSGTAEVLPIGAAASVDEILGPPALAMAASKLTTGARQRTPDAQLLLLPEELALTLGRLGITLAAQQHYLLDRASTALTVLACDSSDTSPLVRSAADILIAVTGGPGVKMTHLPLWAGGSRPIGFEVAPL
jgi:hypothetical protein